MIDNQTIQRLRELPIEGVAERLGLKVSHHKALCPFHDDTTPSLTFYRAKNIYHCFVCNAHGGTIDMVTNKLHLNFPSACRWLADESNIIIEAPSPLPPHPSPLTPNPSPPRFKFPQGSQCHIYNLPVLRMLKEGEQLFITEGCSDCWAMLSAGHKAIAIPSATLLKEEDVATITRQLPPNTSIHMYPDQDAPGERLFLELQAKFPTLVHHQLPEGCKDFSDYFIRNLK